MFRRLGLFPGPAVTPPIAANLAGVTLDVTAGALTLLQECSLLTAVGDQRYWLHDLLRLYAGERCGEEDTAASARTGAALALATCGLPRRVLAGEGAVQGVDGAFEAWLDRRSPDSEDHVGGAREELLPIPQSR